MLAVVAYGHRYGHDRLGGSHAAGGLEPVDRRVVDRTRSAVHMLVDGSDPTILGVANQLRSMPIAFDSGAVSSSAPLLIVP